MGHSMCGICNCEPCECSPRFFGVSQWKCKCGTMNNELREMCRNCQEEKPMPEMLNPNIGDKYQAQETNYAEDEAEYDASNMNFQIVDNSGDIIGYFFLKEDRDHVLKLLNANPIPE